MRQPDNTFGMIEECLFPIRSAYWELHFWRPYQPILREEESERKKHQTLHRILEEEYHPVCQCRRFRVDVIAALKGRTVTRTREEKVMNPSVSSSADHANIEKKSKNKAIGDSR